jgi:hypothetical protein
MTTNEAIAVSIFIKQTGGKVSISSISTDSGIAKAIEKMLCEQAENIIKYIDASYVCMEAVDKAAHEPGQHQSR